MKKISLLRLTFVSAALFMTLRNMPMMAITGMQMFFFNILTAFFFLIPVALVSAELATGWPKAEGVYHWVRLSFGERIGFLATWLQWLQSMFGMSSILAYIGTTVAYIIHPPLAMNPWFIFAAMVAVYWLLTFDNLYGEGVATKISSWALALGVLLPTVLLIAFGMLEFAKNGWSGINVPMNYDQWIPNLGDKNRLIMLMGFIFGYVGIEVSAHIANNVDNPSSTYPKGIFLAVIMVFVFTLLGALSIYIKIPAHQISESSGVMQIFTSYLSEYNLEFLMPIIAGLIAFGTAGQVSTWVSGPVDGLYQASLKGEFFSYFNQVNKYNVPVRLLFMQAVLLTLVSLSVLFFEDVNAAFIWLTSLAVILYAVMYILLFLSAIKLRYTYPEQERPYKVPFGNFGMWAVSISGIVVIFICLLVGFIPLSSLSQELKTAYPYIMLAMTILSIIVGLLIYKKR
ncbi:amino acid permease [Aureibacter tunicatorum]|uniref:Amino acid transporter n=1 Tax=Aureibacter tunicatorum TaxID=866807 RepID=A0AAE3XRK3_9BACT|nr:amino acid permease [Aureibacter tunicatorum]MDR6240601.1 amino acid transporter [Aureibacter tunicatorum]BDD06538.1 transporter [Aureibacter tunicatorum]